MEPGCLTNRAPPPVPSPGPPAPNPGSQLSSLSSLCLSGAMCWILGSANHELRMRNGSKLPSPRVRIAHEKTHEGQREERLETLDTRVEGSDEELGDFARSRLCRGLGKVRQNWAGENGR